MDLLFYTRLSDYLKPVDQALGIYSMFIRFLAPMSNIYMSMITHTQVTGLPPSCDPRPGMFLEDFVSYGILRRNEGFMELVRNKTVEVLPNQQIKDMTET